MDNFDFYLSGIAYCLSYKSMIKLRKYLDGDSGICRDGNGDVRVDKGDNRKFEGRSEVKDNGTVIEDFENYSNTPKIINDRKYLYNLKLEWNNSMLVKDKIVIGKSTSRMIELDFKERSHFLVIGQTGSGKSCLGTVLLWNFINSSYSISILDAKGGVDFKKLIKNTGNKIRIETEIKGMHSLCKNLYEELEARMKLFNDLEVKNIFEYNKKYPQQALSRHTIFIDEASEIFGFKPRIKELRELYDEMVEWLFSIIRRSRAFGINLLIFSQYPSKENIPTNIKNLCNIRISGYLDNPESSRMIFQDAYASKMPKSPGYFVMKSDGESFEEFRVPYFDESKHLVLNEEYNIKGRNVTNF